MALEDEDRLTLMFEDSPISTPLSGPREPPSEQSIARPSPRLSKMSEYKDLNDNASIHSLDSESEGLDISIIQTVGAKKALESANEKLRRSSREKNPVSHFGYNDYMAPLRLHDEGDFSTGAGDVLRSRKGSAMGCCDE